MVFRQSKICVFNVFLLLKKNSFSDRIFFIEKNSIFWGVHFARHFASHFPSHFASHFARDFP